MKTRIGVIGTGAMGLNHVRVYQSLPNVEVVALSDIDSGWAGTAADRYGGTFYADYHKMLERGGLDAVTVAVPTPAHAQVVLDAIACDLHVLVEKPVALTVPEAVQMIDAARHRNVILMVGHIERFNPAVQTLKENLEQNRHDRLIHIAVRRQGPFPQRISGVGATIDLAVHDLDVLRFLTGSEWEPLYCKTQSWVGSPHDDLVTAVLQLNGGPICTLNVNWMSPIKIREMDLITEEGMWRLDYVAQELVFIKQTRRQIDPEPPTIERMETNMIRHHIVKQEPLRLELEAFVQAVRGEAAALPTGADGLIALEMACALLSLDKQALAVP